MEHVKLIKRPDGSRVRIICNSYMDGFRNNRPVYSFTVEACKKGKRNFNDPWDGDSYEVRRLSIQERVIKQKEYYLTIVTKEEVNAAYLELWQKLKPPPL